MHSSFKGNLGNLRMDSFRTLGNFIVKVVPVASLFNEVYSFSKLSSFILLSLTSLFILI